MAGIIQPGPVLESLLEHGGFDGSLELLAGIPELADYIFRWGRANVPGRPWRGHTELLTLQDFLVWHTTTATQYPATLVSHGQPPYQPPIDSDLVEDNRANVSRPMEWLIERDHVLALRQLRRLGYWNPLAFTTEERTYLAYATRHGAHAVTSYIVDLLVQTQSTTYITSLVDIQGANPNQNTLDVLLQEGQYTLFLRLYNILMANDIPLNIAPASCSALCRYVDSHMATHLFINQNIDLSDPAKLALTHGNTPWHLAVENRDPSLSFLHWLHGRTPHTMDTRNQRTHANNQLETPILHAQAVNNYPAFDQLLKWGAQLNPDRLYEAVLATLPQTSNKFLRRLQPLLEHPAGRYNTPGSLLHVILQAVINERLRVPASVRGAARQSRYLRTRQRAARLISFVRRGNARGYPDPDIVGNNGMTAVQTASFYGWDADIGVALTSSAHGRAQNAHVIGQLQTQHQQQQQNQPTQPQAPYHHIWNPGPLPWVAQNQNPIPNPGQAQGQAPRWKTHRYPTRRARRY